MKLLIAEDDVFFRGLLEQVLGPEYELVSVENGTQACDALQQPEGPHLAILDWVMPGMTGPQVCRQVRQSAGLGIRYLVILTARNSPADIVSGLNAGADDYVTKPFDPEELRARIRLGKRLVQAQQALHARTIELSRALERERRLASLLPICPHCRRVRSDSGYWLEVERYVDEHTRAEVRAKTCPLCHTAANAMVPEPAVHYEAP